MQELTRIVVNLKYCALFAGLIANVLDPPVDTDAFMGPLSFDWRNDSIFVISRIIQAKR